MDAPEYQQPAMDPAYARLLEQSKQDANNAAVAGARQEGNRLEATYGTLTSADSGALLARYGANLAMANAAGGMSNVLDPLKRAA